MVQHRNEKCQKSLLSLKESYRNYDENITLDENYCETKTKGETCETSNYAGVEEEDNDDYDDDKSICERVCGDNDFSTNVTQDEKYCETKIEGETCENGHVFEEKDRSSEKKSCEENDCSTNIMQEVTYCEPEKKRDIQKLK